MASHTTGDPDTALPWGVVSPSPDPSETAAFRAGQSVNVDSLSDIRACRF